jgi:hypothetical protein
LFRRHPRMFVSMRKRNANTLPLDQRLALTIDNSAKALDCSRTKIYELKKSGAIEFISVDGMTRVSARSLRRLVGEEEPERPP